MNTGIAFARKMSAAYTAVCKPLCQSLHLPQTAFDILMFLGNNPEYSTARDIVEVRQIKANLVSVNVDRLVKDTASMYEKSCPCYKKGTGSAAGFCRPADCRSG